MSDLEHLSWSLRATFFLRDACRRFGKMALFWIVLCAFLAQSGHASEWLSLDNTSDGIQIFKKESGDGRPPANEINPGCPTSLRSSLISDRVNL